MGQSRLVGVAVDRLERDNLWLDVGEGRWLLATRSRVEVHPGGIHAWAGTIEGDPLSAVTFVHTGDLVQGTIRATSGTYVLQPMVGGPDHLLRQVDTATLPPELPPLVPPLPPAAADQPRSAPLDDGPIDVLAVYTAAARQQAGGSDAAVQSRIALGITEANSALANSRVPHRLRLVGSELVGYHESGDLGIDLHRVTDAADGTLDEVHARRDAVGADLVSLIVSPTPGGGCGVAWVMQEVSARFAPYAFSAVAYPCISPNYTLGHELAHNMGTAHAPDDPNAPPAFPYAYGYKDPLRRFRTVMAYDCRGGCPRVLHFSNPAVSYAGRPTGTAALQNNARALTESGPAAAGFRAARPPGTILGAPTALSARTEGTTVLLSWDPATAGTPAAYLVEVGTEEGFADVATFVVPATATTFLRERVPAGTYWVRVRAADATGPGAPSSSVSLRMTEWGRCEVPVSAPALQQPAVKGTRVTLAWSPPASGGPATKYLIGAGTRPQALDAGVIDTGSATTTITIEAGAGLYFVRVAGMNGCGVGAASNEVVVTIGPPVPGPPGAVVAGISVDRVVTLTWQPPTVGGAPERYVIEVGDGPGLANVAVLESRSATPSLVVTAPPGLYYVRVRARNGAGTSAPSEEVRLIVL